ncbi:MAG TPA: hypothetical protein PKL96_03765 [Bacteroidales bacterium]|nr:hypothetical protein [Bacteroidales bacterium]
MYKGWLILLAALLFFCSCTKNNDTSAPSINIVSPLENQLFQVGDTVQLIADICDDRQLNYVSIRIVNSDYISATPALTFYPENNCTDINHGIPIGNMMLESGAYYVLVTAFDGTNTTNEFRKIGINAVEKRLSYILVLAKNDDQLNVYKIDSLNTVSQVKTIHTDYCGSAISNNARQFYIAGRYTGDVSVFSINNWQLQWNVPVIENPPFPYFEAIDVYNGSLYVSYREGMFHIYNETGSIVASHVTENGEYPLVFLPFKDYLITYEVSPGSSQKHLMAYFVPSFSIYKKIPINFEILKIFPMNENECLLFCNYGGHGVIKLFSLTTGSVTDMYNFTNGLFTDVTQMEPTQYLFSSDAAIWHFSYDYKGISLLINAQNPQNLVFDETEGCYYFSENYFTVTKNRFLPSETLGSFTFQDTIINILPVYNRD